MDGRVLLVDDERPLLAVYERSFEGRFPFDTASSAAQGLELVATRGPYAVIVSDLHMPPGIGGLEFAARVKDRAPDTVCMVLTGNAELDVAIEALNNGRIFRFMTKPCNSETLVRSIEAGLAQYQLVLAERDVLENTLGGCVEIMSEVLSLLNPSGFSAAYRIKKYVRHMVTVLKLKDTWEFELAALLSQLGCIILPPDVLDRAYAEESLSARDRSLLSSHPKVGAELLTKIPRFKPVAAMIAEQMTPSPLHEDPGQWDRVALGAHILRVAFAVDRHIVRGKSSESALSALQWEGDLPLVIVEALRGVEMPSNDVEQSRMVKACELRLSMILDEGVKAKNGMLLAAKGQEVTDTVLKRLQSFAQGLGVVEPFRVRVPAVRPMSDDPCSSATVAIAVAGGSGG